MMHVFFTPSEHQEAFEDPLQQVSCQHGCAPRGEDLAFGRVRHSGALHEVLSGTAGLLETQNQA